MPYKLSIDSAGKGFITEYSGVLTTEEFVACTREKFIQGEEFLSSEYINSFTYSLSDLTEVSELAIDLDAIKNSANLSAQALELSRAGIMIVVAPTEVGYGLGRLWQTYADGTNNRVRLFRSRKEAEAWIADGFPAS